MTIGIWRACAARHTAVTNSGNRLSTSTASASATSPAGSGGSTLPRLTPRRVAMVFSPVASSRISDTEAVPSFMRTTPLQSMPSLARSARMRLLTWSSPPPSGPAKPTRPPRRATATAALAAQPPPVMMNSDADTLAPGAGKFCTRMTMSCTAMPAHKIFGACPGTGSVKADLVLHPGADEVMRDRHRRRRGQAIGVLAHQHGRDLRLGKPPGVLEFLAVHHNFAGQGLGVAADHQRGRKRPRLRVEILHPATGDAGFLARFPPHRVLDRFARLDEAGQARPHGRHKTRAAAEQAALAVACQHDSHRIGAREMFGLALRAIALPAGLHGLRRRAAIGAEAVAQMPVQHRL